jgi:hypothetical protein
MAVTTIKIPTLTGFLLRTYSMYKKFQLQIYPATVEYCTLLSTAASVASRYIESYVRTTQLKGYTCKLQAAGPRFLLNFWMSGLS